jgi:hypothetical protein
MKPSSKLTWRPIALSERPLAASEVEVVVEVAVASAVVATVVAVTVAEGEVAVASTTLAPLRSSMGSPMS